MIAIMQICQIVEMHNKLQMEHQMVLECDYTKNYDAIDNEVLDQTTRKRKQRMRQMKGQIIKKTQQLEKIKFSK